MYYNTDRNIYLSNVTTYYNNFKHFPDILLTISQSVASL
jgi:hypothetical protein